MIPKKIHYCWFSGERMPETMRRCLRSWDEKLPGYERILWDLEKLDAVEKAECGAFNADWVRHWLERRNFAFAADYVRLWALWREGGVYLDTDVEVLKPFDDLLDRDLLLGEESGTGDVEAAVIGSVKGNSEIKKVLDSFGDCTDETLPRRMKRILGGTDFLPSACLSPKDWRTGRIRVSPESYAIHHFAGSWLCRKERAAQWAGRHLGKWAVPVVRWVGHRLEK